MEIDEATRTNPAVTAGGGNRRPMNAFLLFCKRHRSMVKEVYPNLENRHITKILGEFWGSLSQEEKMPFSDLATAYKDHLMRDQSVVNRKPPSPLPTASNTGKEEVAKPVSQGSSGSSSPEPAMSTSAPKPFKKRYLAAEKAKISGESIERKSACEALLKLAEGDSTSSSNQSTNCNGAASKSNPYDKLKETAQFSVLRQAVWTRVAKTILTQEEEKGKNATANHDDKPINLSSQCLIPNSTIIEHIVENILNDNGSDIASANNSVSSGGGSVGSECNEQVKEKILQSLKDDVMRRTNGGVKDGSNDLTALWKMLPNPTGGLTKKNGLHPDSKSTKEKAHSAPASQTGSGAPSPKSESVSVTLVTETDLPLNLSKTPPQTPASTSSLSAGIAITITTSPAKRKLLDEDDDDVRRSSRACKGRRYQEFKDAVGRRGRGRAYGKSDGEGSQNSEDEASHPKNVSSFSVTTPDADVVRQVTSKSLVRSKSPFDLDKALLSIPALRPEEFQRRIQVSRQQQQHRQLQPSDNDLHLSATVMSAKKSKKSSAAPANTNLIATSHGH